MLNSRNYLLNCKPQLPLQALLFLFLNFCSAQGVPCSYKNYWYKADYKNINFAKAENSRYNAIRNDKTSNDTVKAKAYNTQGIYRDFSGNTQEAIISFKKALNYLKKAPARQIPVMANIATQYNITGEFDTALKWLNKASNICSKYGSQVDRAQILHMEAASYLYKGNIEKAAALVLEGIKILETIGDSCYLGQLKLTLAGTYLQTNNYQFSAALIEEYLNENKDNKDSKIYAIAIVNYTENLIELNRIKKALALLTDIVPYIKKSGDQELEAVVHAKLGHIYELSESLERSITEYDKAYRLLLAKRSKYSTLIVSNYIAALSAAGDNDRAIKIIEEFRKSPAYKKSHLHEQLEYERTVAEVYEDTRNWKESTTAYKRAMYMCDTLRKWGNGSDSQMQAMYQAKTQKEKNDMLAAHNDTLQKKMTAEKRLLIMYLISSIAILSLILFILRGLWLKNKLQKKELSSVEQENNYLEERHKLEQDLMNSQQQVIDEKQREATSMALQMANYYDGLQSVIDKINDSNLRPVEVKKELLQLIRHKDYWKEFEVRFKNANPDFETTLSERYPILTKNDIQFCSLLKINLSYKEIASLLQISYESAVTKKYRLKKKMGISDDDEFDKLLTNL